MFVHPRLIHAQFFHSGRLLPLRIKTKTKAVTSSDTSMDPPPASKVPYTTFTSRQKKGLMAILILTMLASPLTATIYLPLLPLLASQLNVSSQAINLNITIYIVFQAISPLLFATASDTLGRRPIYLITYTCYTAASLGLALNKRNYAALLVLRALQSLGASAVVAVAFGVVAVAFGVVADVCPPAERGAMLGPTQGAANLAVCLGPMVGGWIALSTKNFAWVFWALFIFGAFVLSVVGTALPETARNVVGNGSLKATGWTRNWYSMVKSLLRNGKEGVVNQRSLEKGNTNEVLRDDGKNQMPKKQKFKLTSPLNAIRILCWKDTSLVLWMAASPYAVWYCVQTSIPMIYKSEYHFNEFQIGLAYLPGGVGTVVGGYVNGWLMDWNYKKVAESIGHDIDRVVGDNLDKFPIEKARARGAWWLLAVYIITLAGYGWSVVAQSHESIPLILQFVLSVLCTCFQQTFNALLVDVFPASPSTAASSSNITRCALSAVSVVTLQPLVAVIGRGWFFTMLAGLSGGGGLAANWAINQRGMQWRHQRLAKNARQVSIRAD